MTTVAFVCCHFHRIRFLQRKDR